MLADRPEEGILSEGTLLSIEEKWMAMIIILLLFIALFFNLGIHPLKHEEPRRALVALEMIFRGNWIVPTELGALYYNKPPIYNWLLIGSFSIFGTYSEFAVRFFSVISFLGMGMLVYIFGLKYVNRKFAVYSSLFLLVTVEILYYFSITGEIDLFYSLLTFAQILAVFHFYRERKFYTLFLLVYLLAAIGSLTKGLPSIAFVGITLLSWLAYQRDLKRLFSLAHILGGLVYLTIVLGYFWWYSLYEDPSGFVTRLFTESSNRTIAEQGFEALLLHLASFPLTTFVNLMPGALLLIFLVRKDFVQWLKSNPFIFFCGFIFMANFFIYWISPGAKARYIYMLYPFPIMLFVYAFLHQSQFNAVRKNFILDRVILLLIVLIGVAGISIPFIPALNEHLLHLWVPASVAILGAVACLYVYLRYLKLRVMSLILLAVVVRFVFNLTVLPIRSVEGSESQDRVDASTIIQITNQAPLHVLEGSMISRTTVFYLERERNQVLNFEPQLKHGHYYLAYEDSVADLPYKSLFKINYNQSEVTLFKVD